jgi:hypothetical protein
MFDVFDVMAFVVFAVLLTAGVILAVLLGSLPGWIARKNGHPQAAAVNVASWLGLAAGGLLWPFALIWAFLKPYSAAPAGSAEVKEPPSTVGPDATARLQSRVDSLETALRDLRNRKEVAS